MPNNELNFEIFGYTGVGRKRKLNEDRFLAINLGGKTSRLLLAVADGMGGYAAGDEASKIAMETLAQTLAANPIVLNWRLILQNVYQQIDKKIAELAESKTIKLGTTLITAIIEDNKAIITNLGDCRAYLLRQGILTQITKDHSWVQEQLDRGEISNEEARTHRHKNVLARSLVGEADFIPDFFEIELREGDAVLLCSDGLWSELSNEEIKEELETSPNLKEACKRLYKTAEEHGGLDNITMAGLEYGKLPRRKRNPIKYLLTPKPRASQGQKKSPSLLLIIAAILLIAAFFMLVLQIYRELQPSPPEQNELPPIYQVRSSKVKSKPSPDPSAAQNFLIRELALPEGDYLLILQTTNLPAKKISLTLKIQNSEVQIWDNKKTIWRRKNFKASPGVIRMDVVKNINLPEKSGPIQPDRIK